VTAAAHGLCLAGVERLGAAYDLLVPSLEPGERFSVSPM
jgi:hypothetical protein